MLMPAARREADGSCPRTASRTILVVSGTTRGQDTLKLMLEGSVYRPTAVAGSGGAARRTLLSADFDAVAVNSPLPDEFGQDLARYAAEMGRGVLLMVKGELLEETAAQVNSSGVLTLGKPLSRSAFQQALSLLAVCQCQTDRLREENARLSRKLEEIRAVCRAKCLLVEYRKLTEPEAHRLIEKEAMDRRITLRAMAEEILEELGER